MRGCVSLACQLASSLWDLLRLGPGRQAITHTIQHTCSRSSLRGSCFSLLAACAQRLATKPFPFQQGPRRRQQCEKQGGRDEAMATRGSHQDLAFRLNTRRFRIEQSSFDFRGAPSRSIFDPRPPHRERASKAEQAMGLRRLR